MTRTPLHEEHVRAMRRTGEVRAYAAGDWLVRLGDPADTFFYLEEGEVEAVEPVTGPPLRQRHPRPHPVLRGDHLPHRGPHAPPRPRRHRLPPPRGPARPDAGADVAIPEMSDIIITVFAARRRRQLESGDSPRHHRRGSRDLRAIAAFASRNRIPYSSFRSAARKPPQPPACALPPGSPPPSSAGTW